MKVTIGCPIGYSEETRHNNRLEVPKFIVIEIFTVEVVDFTQSDVWRFKDVVIENKLVTVKRNVVISCLLGARVKNVCVLWDIALLGNDGVGKATEIELDKNLTAY